MPITYSWSVTFTPSPGNVMSSSPGTLAPEDEEQFSSGRDISAVPDLDETFELQPTSRTLKEALVRRLLTPRGSLAFHPEYGFDLRAYLGIAVDETKLFEIQSGVEAELEADERVDAATVQLSYDSTTMRLTMSAGVETLDGPFEFVMEVFALSNLLQEVP